MFRDTVAMLSSNEIYMRTQYHAFIKGRSTMMNVAFRIKQKALKKKYINPPRSTIRRPPKVPFEK